MRNGFSRPYSIYGLSVSLGLLLLSCSAASPDREIATDPTTSSPAPVTQAPSVMQTPTVQENLAQMLPISAEADVAGQVIQLEVARTPAQQAQGLMYRPALPNNRGMLFPFESPRPASFWMKNTPQPLDMVFLLDGEVKAVIANVPPCTTQPCPTYGPGANVLVNQVIELRSGRAAELGLKAGDQIKIRFIEPQ